MYYRQNGGGNQPSPEQLKQMFDQLPPDIQQEIMKLPKEKQAEMIVMAFQKVQEIMAQEQQGAPQPGMEQAPQAPQPPMRYGGMNRYQEGGAPQEPQGNPSNQHMQELMQGVDAAGGASQGAQMQPQGQPQQGGAPQLSPEQQQQLQQMFAQLPPEVQAQIKQMPPEQQPQAIVQAFQQMQGGQQGAPQEQPNNSMDEEVDPAAIHKMKNGGLIYKGYHFNDFNTLYSTPKGDTHTKMALMRKGGSIRLVKYGKKMQTGGYTYGDSIKGPKKYEKTAVVMSDTTGLGKPMNMNKTSIRPATKSTAKLTPNEIRKQKYNLNQDFKFGGYLPKANFGQFVGDMGKTWANAQLAGLGSPEALFDKSDFKTKAGRDINNVAFGVSKGFKQMAPAMMQMFGGSGEGAQGMGDLSGMVSALRYGGPTRMYQDGGNPEEDTQYDDLYDALEDDKKEMMEQQIDGYLQENNVPLEDEDATRAELRKQLLRRAYNLEGEQQQEEMRHGGSIGYKVNDLIKYEDGGKISYGRVKTYNPVTGDITLF